MGDNAMGFSDYTHSMSHRHLDTAYFIPPAIDDIICRGLMRDWLELREALRAYPPLRDDIIRICANYISDPTEQRYRFWWNYVQGPAVG